MVTGAGTGIGARLAVRLAEAGADLAIHCDSSREQAEGVAATCRGLGRRAEVLQASFALDPRSAAEVIQGAYAKLGRVDVLVNNAGVTSKKAPLMEHSLELFEEIMAVNVTAVWLAAQAAARCMIQRGGGGRIINVGSVHARQSAPGRSAYEASKGAVHSLTASLAIELGEHRITVNCVAPGAVEVERNAEFMRENEAWYVSRTPLGRLGTPDDVASVVVFLAGDGASFITGETIFVDGGVTRRLPLVR